MYSVASCATYAVEICYLALLKQTDLSDAFESECKFFYFSKLQNNNILNHDHHSEKYCQGLQRVYGHQLCKCLIENILQYDKVLEMKRNLAFMKNSLEARIKEDQEDFSIWMMGISLGSWLNSKDTLKMRIGRIMGLEHKSQMTCVKECRDLDQENWKRCRMRWMRRITPFLIV